MFDMTLIDSRDLAQKLEILNYSSTMFEMTLKGIRDS